LTEHIEAGISRTSIADWNGAWTPQQADALYHVPDWGNGYFFVNELGHVAARPLSDSGLAIDLYEVVDALKALGVRFPALIRLQDLLKTRVIRINESFRKAIRDTGYENVYQGVFPIKVNQLREVVEEIVEAGKPYNFGLECGSKAELVAALPYLETDSMLLVCNGCKDAVMMRLMLAGQQLGKNILPVLERYEEYGMLLQEARDMGVPTQFGVRIRLSTAGAGLWSESGGETSKFGISLSELLKLVDELRDEEHPAAFKLLHFHLGSQIADLQNVRQAVEEAGRIYARLLRRGFPLQYVDIGGGLGVSYEAGNPDALGTINYTLDDYTRTVIEAMRDVCDEEKVPHPVIVSESGRAVAAFHSILVVEVVNARTKGSADGALSTGAEHPVLQALAYIHDTIGEDEANLDALEKSYRTLNNLRDQIVLLFRRGELELEQKAYAERLYWSACGRINDLLQPYSPDALPETLARIGPQLADHYLCNFSIFRSLADYWAIGQRFPIMPLHRLDEPPLNRGTLVDLTCDSDGQVKRFISPEQDKRHLELHALRPGEPYYLGCFLHGAYQDIMGDMHNLFGRVTEAHVYADPEEPGNFYIEKILSGATVEEQLAQVQYFSNDLERRMNDLILQNVRAGRVRPKLGVKLLDEYRHAFQESTYLRTHNR